MRRFASSSAGARRAPRPRTLSSRPSCRGMCPKTSRALGGNSRNSAADPHLHCILRHVWATQQLLPAVNQRSARWPYKVNGAGFGQNYAHFFNGRTHHPVVRRKSQAQRAIRGSLYGNVCFVFVYLFVCLLIYHCRSFIVNPALRQTIIIRHVYFRAVCRIYFLCHTWKWNPKSKSTILTLNLLRVW